jgi:hypothetical protein
MLLRLFVLCGALLGFIPSYSALAQAGDRRYENPVHHWVIAYPAGWAVDSQNVGFIQITPPDSLAKGIFGIHTGAVRVATVDALADAVIKAQQASGQGLRILKRRVVHLADSVRAIELETELGVGTVGRSRRLFVLRDGTAYVIDAETYRDSWPAVEAHYVRMIESFRLPRTP